MFDLSNDPPKRPKTPLDAPPPGKQLRMFSGLDRPSGTRDLFDVDGCSKLGDNVQDARGPLQAAKC